MGRNMVSVRKNGKIVARVQYNSNLDHWDGSNWTCGSVGRHLGITKLRNGEYVLIYGTQWQDEKDYAEVVSAEEALQAVLQSGQTEILEEKRFAALKSLMESELEQEEIESGVN